MRERKHPIMARASSVASYTHSAYALRKREEKMRSWCLFVTAAAAALIVMPAQADVQISASSTAHVRCSGSVCTPTAKNAVLNATDLANMQAASDVKVVTGNGAVSISVSASFSWTSTHRLTLDAHDDVTFGTPVVVAGQGGVTIVTSDGGTGGDLIFLDGGKLDFWDAASSLVVNGANYTLVSDIATLARDIKAVPSGNYALAKDYDATPDGTYAAAPILAFAGTFEGLGHAISNLTVAHVSGRAVRNVGLFATSSGTIRDIGLLNANITVGARRGNNYAGALAGQNLGTILRAYTTSTVDYTDYGSHTSLGGLVAVNKGAILLSHSNSTVRLGGGLVGENYAMISQCYSSGAVNGDPNFATFGGGLAGTNGAGATITLSHSNATVSGGFAAGGLLGFNNGIVTLSFAEGHVSGPDAGGLSGGVSQYSGGSISNVYSTATVTGTGQHDVIGGLIGESGEHTVISFAYATGALSSQHAFALGGVLGADYASQPATFMDASWDLTTSQESDTSKGDGTVPNKPGITGLTDKQLKAALPDGFDPTIWGRKKTINNGYPYLLANPPQ